MSDPDSDAGVLAALGGPADIVLSDMSPATVGHAQTDHLRIVALVEAAADFALRHLAPGGALVAKVFEGGTEQALLQRLKRSFAGIRHVKPPASRKGSAEIYLVATGFRGAA
jgi:23S rRNA (uridine2552-2'-O)-methyltransferase